MKFLQNSPLSVYHIYSGEFSVGRSTPETSLLFLYEAVSSFFFLLMASMILILDLFVYGHINLRGLFNTKDILVKEKF